MIFYEFFLIERLGRLEPRREHRLNRAKRLNESIKKKRQWLSIPINETSS